MTTGGKVVSDTVRFGMMRHRRDDPSQILDEPKSKNALHRYLKLDNPFDCGCLCTNVVCDVTK